MKDMQPSPELLISKVFYLLGVNSCEGCEKRVHMERQNNIPLWHTRQEQG